MHEPANIAAPNTQHALLELDAGYVVSTKDNAVKVALVDADLVVEAEAIQFHG